MTLPRLTLIAIASIAVLSGCGAGPDSSGAATSSTAPGKSGALTELVKKDVKVGTGLTAEAGDTAEVEYTGKLKDGTVFDTNGPTKENANPFSFTLGAGMVIKGWDQGVVGMKVGGERQLEIPSTLAYGAEDKGQIPPNSDLYFDVKLLALVKKGQENMYDPPTDVKVGTGPAVKDGDWVTITYVATYVNGKTYVSSPDGKPLEFQTVTGKTPKGEKLQVVGLLYGLKGMKAGGTRELVLPPLLAYTDMQHGNEMLPSNLTLKYTIKLLKVRPGTLPAKSKKS